MFDRSEPIQFYLWDMLKDKIYSNNTYTDDILGSGGESLRIYCLKFHGQNFSVQCAYSLNVVSKNLILTAVHKTDTLQHLLNILIMRIF